MREHLAQMVGGPGTLRFILQPTVAIILGLLHGRRDRRAGRPVYFLGLIRVPAGRRERLREGARAIAIPMAVALVAAYSFQYVIRKRIYFGYGVLYALLFVLLPYLLARGMGYRLAGIIGRDARAARRQRRTEAGGETRDPLRGHP